MQREEERAATESIPSNVVVRPCPRCPLRSIVTKHPLVCFHVTCADSWEIGHTCVDGNNHTMQSEECRRAVFVAYQDAVM